MTDILCRWLNDELSISQRVEQATFAKEFSSGYLIGEVLSKYQLQDDFDQFSTSRTADSKLNNFTRLEPVLHLLGIPFDTNVARDVMTEKHGMATRLLYQMYIALTNKKKANLTGVAMETQRPAAPAKLNAIESGIYKERLKHITPRQTDLNLEQVASRFHEHQIKMEQTAFRERLMETEARLNQQQNHRQTLLERRRMLHDQQSEMVAKLRAAKVNIPKAPARPGKTLEELRTLRMKKEAESTMKAITDFENKLNMINPADESSDQLDVAYILKREEDRADTLNFIKVSSNDEYIGKIRKRLNDDASAREIREKRRRKVLGEQMATHEAQEEARREEMMVSRLMRQSQQERRISVQLLQTRHEKEIIRNNRIMREQLYQERRLRDYEDALSREAELARLNKEEYRNQIQQEEEQHAKIAAQRAEERYRHHYNSCNDIISQIVDFACKVAEYQQLTEKHLPNKLIQDWTELFVSGCPLYETEQQESMEQIIDQSEEEEQRQGLLDEVDFKEYKAMTGEWQVPEASDVTGPPRSNPVVGHIIHRLYNLVHPPTPPPPPPQYPPFPIRACVVGKLFSGKTTVIKKLAEARGLRLLEVDALVEEAVQAHKNNEMMEVIQEVQRPETAATEEVVPSQGQETPGGQPGSVPDKDTPADGAVTAGEGGGAETGPLPEATNTTATTTSAEAPAAGQGAAAATVDAAAAAGAEQYSTEPGNQGGEDAAKEAIPKPANPNDQDIDEPCQDSAGTLPTVRNKLGAQALTFLKRGQPVDDEVVVEILADVIRQIPEGTGWVLDGYPQTLTQAKLLEKALSGYDAFAKESPEYELKCKARRSDLVPDARPAPPPPEPISGIDVVILFDLDDSLCLKRASGRSYTLLGQQQYHEEFKPPPEGSATGVGKQEKVIPITDPSNDQQQIQTRITSFHDSWAQMDEWFTQFGTLRKVDASGSENDVYQEVDSVMESVLTKIQGKDLELPLPLEPEPEKVEPVPETAPGAPPETAAEPPVEVAAPGGPDGKTSRPGSKSSRSGSAKRSPSRSSSKEGKKDSKRSKSESPKRGSSAKKLDKKSSRASSPKSPKSKGSAKKRKTPEPEPEPEPEVPAGPPPPQPGDDDWEFVDLDVEPALANVLSIQWDGVEKSYVKNCKHVFRQVRLERENIYRYFFQIRKDFLNYLRRPDHKQEFVSQWQKDYNLVPDDMREDEETRAELHQRVDDLRERLWNICDERKEQAEREMETIRNDGWLDDRLGVLSNHYITTMQAELDRFQDTVRMLKDYYKGMDGQIPDELNTNYERIPLIELPAERPETPEQTDSDTVVTPTSDEAPGTAKSDRSKSPRAKSPKDRSKSPKDRSKSPKEQLKSPKEGRKSRTPSAKGKRTRSKEKDIVPETSTPSDGAGIRIKIPLVPRRPVSPDPEAKPGTTPGKDKKDKKGVKKSDEVPWTESPLPPQDPDERLLFDAHYFATSAIGQIMAVEMAAKEAEEEAEKARELEKEKEKEKARMAKGKGGKKGKSRSPSPKKGKKDTESTAPTPPISEDLSEEDQQKKLTRDRMREEYYFAVKEEEVAARARLELIKLISMTVLQDLKEKADGSYKDMTDWVGARFLKEMESINTMSEVMRHAVENGQKLKEQVILHQDDFFVDTDHHVLKSPSPPSIPQLTEQVIPDQFTVEQLFNLYQQFSAIAPTGIMSSKSFTETLENTVSVTHGMEQLPDMWMHITPAQIQEISSTLATDRDYVDWRRLLLALTWPIPTPTQTQLLDTLRHFHDMDQKKTGFVTREQYDRMDLWFDVGPTDPDSYDRMTHLKKILFDIFADHMGSANKLNYTSMLLYFSAMPNAHEGFLRALSVASNCHMPRLQKPQERTAQERAASASDSFIPESNGEEEREDKGPVEPPMTADDIPPEAVDALVPLEALFRVFHHSEISSGDSHRFSVSVDPEDVTSKEKLAAVYLELNDEESLKPVLYKVLIEHPQIQDIVVACRVFKALDLKTILSNTSENAELNSLKTMD
ncbi:sperm flagellar protein 2-like isoform X2 [Babylonia areolata]|uniref:sperm flagellar protein 2-like isoform X2 n=1 Tax=Babylonia areolata TaxID=304850 RepID=UPI003FD3AF32